MLETKNLNMSYKNNSKIILKNVSVDLKTGDYVAIMGESGSGKSTLLACIAGILKPVSGVVSWQKMNLYELDDSQLSKIHRTSISYVPQSNVFLKEYNVIENLLIPYMKKGEIEEIYEKRAIELLDSLGIKELKDRFPYELSGGELKRVSIARALIMCPDVIIADEPTTGLDYKTGEIILQFLLDYARLDKIVIIASHDQKVRDYCHVIYRLVDGEVSADEK